MRTTTTILTTITTTIHLSLPLGVYSTEVQLLTHTCVDGQRAKIESHFTSFPCLADLHFRLRFNDTLVEGTGPLLKTKLQKSKCFGTHQMVANQGSISSTFLL